MKIISQKLSSQRLYKQLLESPRLTVSDFCKNMRLLIERSPFFLPPYIELLETYEGTGECEKFSELLAVAAQRRARLGHVLAQAADVERAIAGFWRLRIAIDESDDGDR